MSSPYVYSFRELIVYQKARSLAAAVFTASKAFPRDEMYSLTDQIRRSSRSIGANVAEAWAKRAYEKHFISKLTDADGEQLETQHWLEIGCDCGYLPAQQAAELMGRCEEVGRLRECQKLCVTRNQLQYSRPGGRRLHHDKTEETTNTPRVYAIG